ncbi:hypothetical protein PHMEG_00012839 [Phytophthora megakarya]|uniref:Uncharacterized protein n=1 Tax=Phytophthora megakarya TaxID=4795 RepID=A0A225W7Q8_9STRA|nr:hypothetical protein PHMEG_00012839 [Phytophthora megakarya]
MARALIGFSPARIVWPTLVRQKSLAKLVAAREPLLQFTWGFLDGTNFKVLRPPNLKFKMRIAMGGCM